MKKLITALCAAALLIVCLAILAACSDKSVKSDTSEAHTHVFGTYIVTKYPTCTQSGTETAYCVCHAYDTREIPPLGHALDGLSCQGKHCTRQGCDYTEPAGEHEYTALKIEPDCTHGGYTVYECACKESYIGDETPAKGHSWSEWSVREAATCTEGGRLYRYCTLCPAYEYAATEPTGHKYYVTQCAEATCTECGSETRVCAVCGDTEVITSEASGHALAAADRVPATCTEDGYTLYECTRCGYTEKGDFELKLNHVFDLDAAKTPCLEHCCLRENCTYCAPVSPHAFVAAASFPATCTEKGYTLYVCENCGLEESRPDAEPTGHTFAAVKDSCDKTCTVCGYVETHAHEFESVTLLPDCVTDGYEKLCCVNCGYIGSYTVLPATGHVFAEPISCGETSCAMCGYTVTLPHSYDVSVVTPNCAEEGYTEYRCRECGYFYRTDYTEKTPHSPGKFVYDGNATCTECGTESTYCTECGIKLTREAPGTATGHVFDSDGVCGEKTCTVCGFSASIPHSFSATVTEPTCTEQGYTEYVCDLCGYSYRDGFTECTGHVYDPYYGICGCGRISGTFSNVGSFYGIVESADCYGTVAVLEYYAVGIAPLAFAFNTFVEEVYCGPCLEYIGDSAFFGCVSLKRVFVPENCAVSVTALPEGAELVRIGY